METREIIIANTKTQRRDRISTAATTLGELKADLDNLGIDYEGLTFTEGISKTQLLDDSTQLPQNVLYKGHPTNNLVILLTNTKKKIASGLMSRKEAYQAIKEGNLQEAVLRRYGRNFTQVPTHALVDFLAHSGIAVPTNTNDNTNVSTREPAGTFTKEEPVLGTSVPKTSSASIADNLVVFISGLVHSGFVSTPGLRKLACGINDLLDLTANGEDTTTDGEDTTSDRAINDWDIDDMIDGLNM